MGVEPDMVLGLHIHTLLQTTLGLFNRLRKARRSMPHA